MLRERLKARLSTRTFNETPTNPNFYHEESPKFNEKQLALAGLVFSLSVLSVKIFNLYGDAITAAISERKLITYQDDSMITYTWITVVKYSNILLPITCGLLSAYITALLVYLDSEVPGVQPPSPLSPQKYKLQSGHSFHLNYVFAITVGVLVTFYMYLNGVSIKY